MSTKTLEYSNKQSDPLKLVSCDLEGAEVTADGKVDLTAVGTYAVVYTIAYGGQTKTQTVKYTVRDTKAPKISFVKKNRTIDQGETFDPRDNIEYVEDKVEGTLAYVDVAPTARDGHEGTDQIYDAGWYTIEGNIDSSTLGTYNLLVRASDKHGNMKTREMPIVVQRVEQESAPAAEEHTYIVNVRTGKFHLPGCRDVSRMSEANKWETMTTRDELINSGYSPCMHCNP